MSLEPPTWALLCSSLSFVPRPKTLTLGGRVFARRVSVIVNEGESRRSLETRSTRSWPRVVAVLGVDSPLTNASTGLPPIGVKIPFEAAHSQSIAPESVSSASRGNIPRVGAGRPDVQDQGIAPCPRAFIEKLQPYPQRRAQVTVVPSSCSTRSGIRTNTGLSICGDSVWAYRDQPQRTTSPIPVWIVVIASPLMAGDRERAVAAHQSPCSRLRFSQLRCCQQGPGVFRDCCSRSRGLESGLARPEIDSVDR